MKIVADNYADTLARAGDDASARPVLLTAVADRMRAHIGPVEPEVPDALRALAARLERDRTR